MTKIYISGEVNMHLWNGTGHDIWPALIRAEPEPGNLHANLNLYYWDLGPGNVNNVLNRETTETNEGTTDGHDYWSHAFSEDPSINLSRPWINIEPSEGNVVWLMLWDSGESDHIEYPALVTDVTGTGDNTDLTLRYIAPNGTVNTVTNVLAYSTLSGTDGEDFWFHRREIGDLP